MALLLVLAVLFVPVYRAVERFIYPLEYEQEVTLWADTYDVDPYFVYAVIYTESGFDPQAESGVGARGLMQMTEDTFDWIKGKIAPGDDVTYLDLYQPEVSIRFGVYFLSYCLDKYGGDMSTAAAAYHSGMGTVDALLAQPEHSADGIVLREFPYAQMGHYVNKVNKHYDIYVRLYSEN